MSNDSGSGLGTELGQVREALAAWRATAGKGQRIPDALWRKAVRAAKRHGLNPVSKALGLDYNCLKKHVDEDGVGGNRKMGLTPSFVEVKTASRPPDELGCVVEMEKGTGVRMRICVRDAAGVDWGKLKEAFLGA